MRQILRPANTISDFEMSKYMQPTVKYANKGINLFFLSKESAYEMHGTQGCRTAVDSRVNSIAKTCTNWRPNKAEPFGLSRTTA